MSARMRRRQAAGPDVLEIWTNVLVDDQFSSPKQARWAPAVAGGKLLVANSNYKVHIRNADLSFYNKYYSGQTRIAVDSDATHLYSAIATYLYKYTITNIENSEIALLALSGIRMIDASGDPDYLYVTSNNGTDGHGVRKVRKSDMTVVASLLATGAGNGQFNNPLGIFYYNNYVYVCDQSNNRIVQLNASDLSWVANIFSGSYTPYDICNDGTSWYFTDGNNYLHKCAINFTGVSAVNDTGNCYSITITPDQGDGNGATLIITSNTNSKLTRRKCSDLSLINTVGTAGDGLVSICDPAATGPTGTWKADDNYSADVASGATPTKNGFTGIFFQTSGPHKVAFKPSGGKTLADITAIDFNTDALTGPIKNLNKLVGCASYKLYGNSLLQINLSDINSKATIAQIYSCGVGVVPADLSKCTTANDFRFQDNSWTQAQIDQFIAWIYAGRAGFTDAARSMRIGLNNAVPSGNYTDPAVTPGNGNSNSDWSWDAGLGYHLPLTPNAMVWRLLHAVEPGVSSWSAFITA